MRSAASSTTMASEVLGGSIRFCWCEPIPFMSPCIENCADAARAIFGFGAEVGSETTLDKEAKPRGYGR